MTRIRITTINPAKPGLKIEVISAETDTVLVRGRLNDGGAFFREVKIHKDTIVFLVLTDTSEDEPKELIRCRVPVGALDPMECFMTNPQKLTVNEAHKRFMAKHRELKRNGVSNPDPDATARAAFM